MAQVGANVSEQNMIRAQMMRVVANVSDIFRLIFLNANEFGSKKCKSKTIIYQPE